MSDYVKSLYDILKGYNVDADAGRSALQAKAALDKYGENKLEGKKQRNVFQKFLFQMKDVMVLILIAAAVISFIMAVVSHDGEYIDSIIIIAIVIVNGVLGVRQESKAEKALDSLKTMSAPTAKVVRDGVQSEIPSWQVVPGDVVLIEAGDFIPADGRILESASLRCDESALTGESVPAEKDGDAVINEGMPLADRVNMVYSGSAVSYGRAKIVVTGTGMNTEIGKIAGLLDTVGSETTPLQHKLLQMGKYLGILVLGICTLIFIIGISQRMELSDIFMMSVSLAVAAVPEGLTAVVTVVLALGVSRMVRKNAIIKSLPAVETLGSASVICSDKTGTLTQNRMAVTKVWAVGAGIASMNTGLTEKAKHLLRLGAMCNDGRIQRDGDEYRHVGDPTETAIIAAAHDCGIAKDALDKQFPRLGEIPFDSERKLMTTVHQVGNKLLAVVKGGYDVLLPLCDNTEGSKADDVNMRMGRNALRVIAVACKELDEMPENLTSGKIEKNLMFMGLIGMIDPPREESAEAVRRSCEAGITPVMITGDHVATASAIARRLGILTDDAQAISGAELAAMPQWELEDNIDKYRVYARVSPEDKLRIVTAWQERGDVVAMTGDGVNDAPALKAADIGCAMGITGTDVAKSAADMVLTDDNFATIVDAVETGRGIYDNIKKTIQFLLSANLGEIIVVLFAMLFGWGAPLLAIHLLIVNVVTDAFPAFALGVEPVDKGVMLRKPSPRNEGVFANGLGVVIILQGIMLGILTLCGYYIGAFVDISEYFPHSHEIGMTMAFFVLALSQLAHALNCRSKRSIFKIGLFSNKAMIKAFLGSVLVIVLISLVPLFEKIFKISDLSMAHWLIVAGLSAMPLVLIETAKSVFSIGNKNKRGKVA